MTPAWDLEHYSWDIWHHGGIFAGGGGIVFLAAGQSAAEVGQDSTKPVIRPAGR